MVSRKIPTGLIGSTYHCFRGEPCFGLSQEEKGPKPRSGPQIDLAEMARSCMWFSTRLIAYPIRMPVERFANVTPRLYPD